jgi:hypothetical protein
MTQPALKFASLYVLRAVHYVKKGGRTSHPITSGFISHRCEDAYLVFLCTKIISKLFCSTFMNLLMPSYICAIVANEKCSPKGTSPCTEAPLSIIADKKLIVT